MLIDWGLPPKAQVDLLEDQAEYIDLAKVAVGISGIVPESRLRRRITAYQDAKVDPFPGGMFAELAQRQGKIEQYFSECVRVGYNVIEISDNVVHYSADQRKDLIRRAIDDHGLRVIGEVGSKQSATDDATLIADVTDSLEAGAWLVLLEAAEFLSADGLNTALIKRILSEVDASKVMFELPGRWLDGYQIHQAQQLARQILDEIGPNANLGNIIPEDVLSMETLRTGLGVSMKF